MSVSVNTLVAGSATTGLGMAGTAVPANVNALVAGGVTATVGTNSADFSDPNNSMYAIYFTLGLGVN